MMQVKNYTKSTESAHPTFLRCFFSAEYQEHLQELDPAVADRAQLVARRIRPTIQERVVEQIIRDLPLRMIPQWLWRTAHETFIFDFLVEPNLVVECSLTERKGCSDAKHWLKSRAAIIDRRFKELTRRAPHLFTVMFLEAISCPPAQLHAALLPLLEYTDRLITSIDELEAFAQQWQRTQVQPKARENVFKRKQL